MSTLSEFFLYYRALLTGTLCDYRGHTFTKSDLDNRQFQDSLCVTFDVICCCFFLNCFWEI